MRRVLVILCFAGLGLMGPGTAAARDMNGRFAVGAQRTLAGIDGFDVLYWAGRLALNGTINLLYHNPKDDTGGNATGIDIKLAVGALLPMITSDRFELAVGGRLDLATRDPGGTQISLEAPLRLAWFITDHLLVYGEVGLVIELIPDEGRNVTPAGELAPPVKGTGIYIGATGLTGGGGFSFIF